MLQNVTKLQTVGWKRGPVTDLDVVGADVEHADHAGDEVADGFEVDASDAPGTVH